MRLHPSLRAAFQGTLFATALVVTVTSGAISATARSHAPVAPRGTVTWAEAPQDPPDYIFPFISLRYLKVSTLNDFQYLMYRPLYWFGKGRGTQVNPQLSLAQLPRFSAGNTLVTVSTKAWRWSNGETVDARSVVFWMNMLRANKTNWADYVPGSFPDNVASISITGPNTLDFHLTRPVNPQWFIANNLSHITPLPQAWDISSDGAAPGSGGCSSARFDEVPSPCRDVYRYLSRKAGFDPEHPAAANSALASYATEALWQIVDGPWRLSKFDAEGHVTMTANPHYSGKQPHFKTFVEVPFASAKEELRALANKSVDVGYLPRESLSSPDFESGRNLASLSDSYRLHAQYLWSINYVPYNFASSADDGATAALFSQPYIREALQSLVDQGGIIAKVFHGYGRQTISPIPLLPGIQPISGAVHKATYPYRPAHATKLLAKHGWRKVHGVLRCQFPTRCGPGIPKGASLSLKMDYAQPDPYLAEVVAMERQRWKQAGIAVTTHASSYSSVLNTAVPCSAGSSCQWQLENWGSGWNFGPDYYPSGEAFLSTGAGSNVGSFSDAASDQLIASSIASADPHALGAYATRIAKILPVLWQPQGAYALVETRNELRSSSVITNPLAQLNPESWYRFP